MWNYIRHIKGGLLAQTVQENMKGLVLKGATGATRSLLTSALGALSENEPLQNSIIMHAKHFIASGMHTE